MGGRNCLDLCIGIGIDLVLGCWTEMLGFSVGIEIDLVLVWAVGIDLGLAWGWKNAWFSCLDRD